MLDIERGYSPKEVLLLLFSSASREKERLSNSLAPFRNPNKSMRFLRLKLFLSFAGVLLMSFSIGPAISSMMELGLIVPAFLTFGSAGVILISFMIWVSKLWLKFVAVRDLFAPGTALRSLAIVLLLLISYLFNLAVHLLRVPSDPISDAVHDQTATASCVLWGLTTVIAGRLYYLKGIILLLQRPLIATSISFGFRCADIVECFAVRYSIYFSSLLSAVVLLLLFDAGIFLTFRDLLRRLLRRAPAA